jgi:hypothetical protein
MLPVPFAERIFFDDETFASGIGEELLKCLCNQPSNPPTTGTARVHGEDANTEDGPFGGDDGENLF